MKTRILSLCFFLFCFSAITYTQSSSGNNDSLLNKFGTLNEARLLKQVTIGAEYSGFSYNKDYPLTENYGVSVAIYRGSSSLFDKTIQDFAENSPLYHTYNVKSGEYKYSNTFIYFAPGISLYSVNRNFSLDLYKKLETQTYINGKQQIAPVKVSFHF